MFSTSPTLSFLKKFFSPVMNEKVLWSRIAFLEAYRAGVLVYFANLIKWVTNAIVEKDIDSVYRIGFIYAGLIIMLQIFQWWFRHDERLSNNNWWVFLRKKYLERLMEIDNNTYESVGTGRFISILQSGVTTWMLMIATFFTQGIGKLVTTVLVCASLIAVHPIYFVPISLFLLLSSLLFIWLSGKIQQNRDDRKISWTDQGRLIVKIIMSKFEILQQWRIHTELHALEKIADREQAANYRLDVYQYPMEKGLKALIDVFRIVVIFIVWVGAIKGEYTVGDISTLMLLLVLLDSNAIELIRIFTRGNDQFIDVKKLWETFDDAPSIIGYNTGKDFEFKKGNIEFKNVNFSYTKGTPIFSGFHLKITGGKKFAIVGQSGCGKSTLMKLIAGYIHPNTGNIFVDQSMLPNETSGDSKECISLKTYYPHIGYLTQEPSIFDGSIFENLTYGLSDKAVLAELTRLRVSDPEGLKKHPLLSSVLESAKCEFIYHFPDGLGTEIGERGVKLSGGQKQRLAIAKIFLKNPNIILLDEPTSALDSFAEEEVSYALENLFKKRTVIVIAHRLQTVKKADEIIVLEAGQVVERGSHMSLIKKAWMYAKMLELQSGF